jgi:hypothetical protein
MKINKEKQCGGTNLCAQMEQPGAVRMLYGAAAALTAWSERR